MPNHCLAYFRFLIFSELSKCKDGYHGSSCIETCPASCKKNCYHTNGDCKSCDDVTMGGKKCDQPCSKFCLKGQCHQLNMTCRGCEQKRYGFKCENNCTGSDRDCSQYFDGVNCLDGYYGIGSVCPHRCSPHCSTTYCEKNTGRCRCSNGRYEKDCRPGKSKQSQHSTRCYTQRWRAQLHVK